MKVGYWRRKSGAESVVHLVSENNHPVCGALPSGEYHHVSPGIQVGLITCLKCRKRAVELARQYKGK